MGDYENIFKKYLKESGLEKPSFQKARNVIYPAIKEIIQKQGPLFTYQIAWPLSKVLKDFPGDICWALAHNSDYSIQNHKVYIKHLEDAIKILYPKINKVKNVGMQSIAGNRQYHHILYLSKNQLINFLKNKLSLSLEITISPKL